jgi:hypothetical protein
MTAAPPGRPFASGPERPWFGQRPVLVAFGLAYGPVMNGPPSDQSQIRLLELRPEKAVGAHPGVGQD